VGPAISVEHLSKAYRLGTIGGGTLAEDLSRWWAKVRRQPDPLLKVGQDHHARRMGELFWALDDVSFQVNEGDVLGLIGRNGAGKSTLLKILSQVTAPTSGQIRMRGRITSLLEVGTGFHPELTGRENVFLNGAILGMTKAEIRRTFDEIVAFSEVEEFIDTPVKRYSSGMYVRLAFAVAAHLEPEILIVDEVLAVGDAQFQKKCLGKMRDVSQHGRTILFVSHSMAAISALCTRAVLVRDGRLAADGDTSRVVAAYQADQTVSRDGPVNLAELTRQGTGKGRFVSLHVAPAHDEGTPRGLVPGCDVLLTTEVRCHSDFAGLNVAAIVFDGSGSRLIDVNTALQGEFLSLVQGQRATVTFRLRDVLLKPGVYRIALWMGRGGLDEVDYVDNAGTLQIDEAPSASKHTETFPGVYQCRFAHSIEVTPV
jgi:lipopolysaccharide transport system ATP-binding protein